MHNVRNQVTRLKIKMQKQIALVLAILLFLLPLSEIRPYAAETAESLTSEDNAGKTQDFADEKASLETPSSVQNYIEEQTGTKSEAEKKDSVESAFETKTEQTLETEEEAKTATTAENALESTSETVSDKREEAEEYEEIDYPCPEALEPENVPYDQNQEEFTRKLVYGTRARSMMPARYDSREIGYLPEIRNQGSWGACWSFSLTGAMEVSMIKDMSVSADSIDLSERHLAYFGFNTGYDALDNANGDTMTSPASYYLDNGGNDLRGVIRLMNWNGGAQETDYPYSTSTLPDALERTVAQDAAVYLENAYRYDFASAEDKTEAIKVVKKMIMDYGAVSWSYYNGSQYLNKEDGKSYYNYNGGTGSAKTNHAIMAVGWDDHYAKENFAKDHQPENDGAWIIRNSWGDTVGEDGYIYISYEDVSLGSANPVYAVTTCDTSKYDNNYFYGNTAFSTATIAVRRAAQVYTMKSEHAVREKLTAVSLLIGTSDVEYELQIYKNPDTKDGIVTDPTSGTPMLDAPQTGTLGYAGLHTITLDTPLEFDADDKVSVVFTFPKEKPSMYFDRSYTSDYGQQRGVHVIAKGQSFYGSSLTSWEDNYESNRTFRINALTVDCDDVEEVPNIKEIRVTEAQDFSEYPQVNITWLKCTDVDCYRVYRAEEDGDFALIETVSSLKRTYTDTISERTAVQYQYKIAAVYADSEKLSDAEKAQIKGTVGGSKLTVSAYDGDTAALTWDQVAGADGYELWQLSDGGSDYERIAEFDAGAALSYIATTDDWGTYRYRVRAKRADEYTDWSEVCINRDLRWEQKEYYKAYFEWQPVEGALSYKLWHKANGKSFSITTTNVSVNSSMKSAYYLPCDEHQYYVEAYDALNAGGNKIYTSSTITFQMTPDAPVIDTVVYDYEKHIALTWNDVSNVDKIKIYRSEVLSETGTFVAEVNAEAMNYADSVQKGKTYYYTLRSVAVNNKNEQVEGASVTSKEITTFPDAVTLDTAQYVAQSGVTLSWNTAKGADGYLVERNNGNGEDDFSVIATIEDGTATTYTDQTVKRGNTYRYRMMSYYWTEEDSKATIPVQNEVNAAVSPKPAMFAKIEEQKREAVDIRDGKTRVGLSWNAVENAQSYAIYRCVVSEDAAEHYECIAENITQEQYVDSSVIPDTSYRYKLIVKVNGLSSELEETKNMVITTKPVLLGLNLSMEHVDFVKNTEQQFRITALPSHYPYEQEIVWSAKDENGNKLSVIQENDTTVIKDADGKELLFISGNKIQAAKDSETMKITLIAAIDEIHAQCELLVYSDDFSISGVKNIKYTGKAITQTIAVYDGKMRLTENVDYTVAYKNNIKVSTKEKEQSKKPQIIVTGKGRYTGEKTVYFEILPKSSNSKTSDSGTTADNSTTPANQDVTVGPKSDVKSGEDTLTVDIDDALSYENNEEAGTETVVINGIDDYTDEKWADFTKDDETQDNGGDFTNTEPDTEDISDNEDDVTFVSDAEGTEEHSSYENSDEEDDATAGELYKKAFLAVGMLLLVLLGIWLGYRARKSAHKNR